MLPDDLRFVIGNGNPEYTLRQATVVVEGSACRREALRIRSGRRGSLQRLRVINGKLSALRWVLGEEWDMLDT